jgi:hypothetical protein
VLITNVCTSYARAPSSGCAATFYDPSAEGSAASTRHARAAQADREREGGQRRADGHPAADLLGQGGDPSVDRRREQNLDALRKRARQGSPALTRRTRRSTISWGVTGREARRRQRRSRPARCSWAR